MSDRVDTYTGQKVTQAELDKAFGYAESAERNTKVDLGLYGVLRGFVPTLPGGGPNVTITTGTAFDQNGKRIKSFTDAAGSKTQSFATDTAGASTSVTTGNERWISVYAMAGRQALDSRNAGTVYFDQPECLHDGTVGVLSTAGLGGTGVDKFLIVAGAAAATGTASKPALRTDAILVCDIKRTPSDASNVLDLGRRMTFYIADTAQVGTTVGAGGGASGPTGNGLAVLMSAIGTWTGGRVFGAAASLNAALAQILTDLGATASGDDGAERIGTQTAGNLAGGSVRAQLNELDTNKGGLSLANIWSAINTFSTQMKITPTQGTAALTYASAVVADARLLLFEFDFNRASQTNTKLRVYLNNKPIFTNGPQRSLLITQGVSWNGTNWIPDDTGTGSGLRENMMLELGGRRGTNAVSGNAESPGFVLYKAASGGASLTDSNFSVFDYGATWAPSNTWSIASQMPYNQANYPGGTNQFNQHNGEFVIGQAGASRTYNYNLVLYGPASGVLQIPMSYNGVSWTSGPSNVTVTNTTATNCSTPTATAGQTQFTLATTVTALGTFTLAGSVLFRL